LIFDRLYQLAMLKVKVVLCQRQRLAHDSGHIREPTNQTVIEELLTILRLGVLSAREAIM
jgi:hypothetical protein